MKPSPELPLTSFARVREALLARREIALLDVREEHPFAQGHPLFAANLPLARIELDAFTRIPRLDTAIVVYDDGEGLAEPAARRLQDLGYTDVSLLAGGLQGWREAGGELFIDVNGPSKAFGELVESVRHTPSLSAQEVNGLLASQADVVVLDVRRFDEYRTMSIPGAVSVPGAELVWKARSLAPDPSTRIVVNCAGRTRSIIGTQSLVNAGLPNPVAALRNGTMGWLLAGQELDHGATRRGGEVDAARQEEAAARARGVAERAGVRRAGPAELARFLAQPGRTTYRFDVRTPEEFEAGHLPGFRNFPGGQLVQETDHGAPVRGARIVLFDDDGVRANMTGSWLAQMAWEVWVLHDAAAELAERGPVAPRRPQPHGPLAWTRAQQLAADLRDGAGATAVLDFSPSARYVEDHIPGAWFVLRSQLAQALQAIPPARRYVLTCGDGSIAQYAAHEVGALRPNAEVRVLDGGNAAWKAAGLPGESGETRLASPRIDRYRRPYEGTHAQHAAMQAYLDWEFGLVAQLARDGTHGFQVL